MSYQYSEIPQSQVLYSADSDSIMRLRSIRDRIDTICKNFAGQAVRVQTIDGHVFEGIIVGCDQGLLHLKVSDPTGSRAFASYAYFAIITLVLYELLVITLMII